MTNPSVEALNDYICDELIVDHSSGPHRQDLARGLAAVAQQFGYTPPKTLQEALAAFGLRSGVKSALFNGASDVQEAAQPDLRSFVQMRKDMETNRVLAIAVCLELIQLAQKSRYAAVACTQTLESAFNFLTGMQDKVLPPLAPVAGTSATLKPGQ